MHGAEEVLHGFAFGARGIPLVAMLAVYLDSSRDLRSAESNVIVHTSHPGSQEAETKDVDIQHTRWSRRSLIERSESLRISCYLLCSRGVMLCQEWGKALSFSSFG